MFLFLYRDKSYQLKGCFCSALFIILNQLFLTPFSLVQGALLFFDSLFHTKDSLFVLFLIEEHPYMPEALLFVFGYDESLSLLSFAYSISFLLKYKTHHHE